MKVLFCGDIVGRSGRKVVTENISKLREEHHLDFVVANGDNVAGGFGINENTFQELIHCGINVITSGDHIWDKKEASELLNSHKNLLRPQNFPKSVPGTGVGIFNTQQGQKVMVIHLMGQTFMKYHVNCPFEIMDDLLKLYRLGKNVDAIMVDFHAEATSEKIAMGRFLDGRVSMVIGTHTHIPTADFQILKGGTAYQTDIGMTGDYNSTIGMKDDIPLKTFIFKKRAGSMEVADGPATMHVAIMEFDNKTGLTKSIEQVIIKP